MTFNPKSSPFRNFLELSIAISISLAACNLPAVSESSAPPGDPTANGLRKNNQATEMETSPGGENPTANQTPAQDVLQLGDIILTRFSTPWFDGDLKTVVFVENGLLRIDSAEEDGEPGVNQVTGAVTTTSYSSFDLSATFNAQGGVCRGVTHPCGNIFVSNCIVFDFVDFRNMQAFCINPTALFWTLIAYENGAVIFHSSAQLSDAIHDTGIIYRYGHPEPNEIRLTLQDDQLTAYINGAQVFTREDPTSLVGYDAAGSPVYRTDGWMSEPIRGKIGAGCVNLNHETMWARANCEIKLILTP